MGLLRRLSGFALIALLGPTSAFLIVPGARVGKITPSSSESELKKAYGKNNVVEAEIELSPGNSKPGTILFPNDPEKRIAILWADSLSRSQPRWIELAGKSSRWKTADGVTLGTTLKELEKLNGRPFVLTGFGYESGGTVLSWERGRLAAGFGRGGHVLLRFEPPRPGALSSKEEKAISGDRDLRSDEPVLRKLNPRVRQIIIEFQSKGPKWLNPPTA